MESVCRRRTHVERRLLLSSRKLHMARLRSLISCTGLVSCTVLCEHGGWWFIMGRNLGKSDPSAGLEPPATVFPRACAARPGLRGTPGNSASP